MAQIKIEEIVSHLSTEFRRALEATVRSKLPDTPFDSHGLFREFRRQVGRKCNTWVRVPDHFVQT